MIIERTIEAVLILAAIRAGIRLLARKRAVTQIATVDEIRFYRANEKPYGAFSNLYKCPVEFEGTVFPTSEHAYQAGKARKSASSTLIPNSST